VFHLEKIRDIEREGGKKTSSPRVAEISRWALEGDDPAWWKGAAMCPGGHDHSMGNQGGWTATVRETSFGGSWNAMKRMRGKQWRGPSSRSENGDRSWEIFLVTIPRHQVDLGVFELWEWRWTIWGPTRKGRGKQVEFLWTTYWGEKETRKERKRKKKQELDEERDCYGPGKRSKTTPLKGTPGGQKPEWHWLSQQNKQ